MLVLGEAHVVKDEELRFRPEVGRVGDARRLDVGLGLLGHVARVTTVGLERQRIVHEAVQVERLVLTERVDHRGRGIRQQDHVRLVDLLEAADGRAVETVALGEHLLRQRVRRDGEVLHESGQVAEPEVDDLDPLVLDEADDLGWVALLHVTSPSEISSSNRPVRARANEIRLVDITADATNAQIRGRVHQVFTMVNRAVTHASAAHAAEPAPASDSTYAASSCSTRSAEPPLRTHGRRHGAVDSGPESVP